MKPKRQQEGSTTSAGVTPIAEGHPVGPAMEHGPSPKLARDPRIDPIPGDQVRIAHKLYTVVPCSLPGMVFYRREYLCKESPCQSKVEFWRKATEGATVVTVAEGE
jgi:hypothetical protein